MDLIPANIELSAIEVSLVNAMSRELILRSMVDRLREFYDYIIIDCMGLLSPRLTAGTRQAWQRRQGFYRYLNVAALPCSLIPTPSDDEQSPGIFHLQEDFE